MKPPEPAPTTIALPAPLTASSTPMDVARCADLAFSARRALLTSWLEDAQDLERAADEGMTGQGRSRLAEVTLALQALDTLSGDAPGAGPDH